jgi:hypothetical protein
MDVSVVTDREKNLCNLRNLRTFPLARLSLTKAEGQVLKNKFSRFKPNKVDRAIFSFFCTFFYKR